MDTRCSGRHAKSKAPPFKERRTGHPKFDGKARATRPGEVLDKSWLTGYTEIDKNIDAWDMGSLGEPMTASPLGAGRLLLPIGWREDFGYKSLQRCGSGVPWGAWLERL